MARKLNKFRRLTRVGDSAHWIACDGRGLVWVQWPGPGEPLLFSVGSSFFPLSDSPVAEPIMTIEEAHEVLVDFERESEHVFKRSQ